MPKGARSTNKNNRFSPSVREPGRFYSRSNADPLGTVPEGREESCTENPRSAAITFPGPQSHHDVSHNLSQSSTPLSYSVNPHVTGQTTASAFHGAHDFSISGDAHFLNVGKQNNFHINHSYGGTVGLHILESFVSFNALHDSSAQDPERRCHPGTRENVLKRISKWIDDAHVSEAIFWLHGPAGVGKSSIAQTISRTHGPEKVMATFFFYRSDTSRNDGNLLFPTLAWQLAKSIPDVRERIASALNKDPDIPRKEIEAQFEHLIAQPLRAIASAQLPPPIVVIDGVDECLGEKLQQRILNILRKAAIGNRVPLRFFISSRPEAHIKDVFHQSKVLGLDLADIDDAHRDIEKYFKVEFARIASEQDLDPVTWPGEDVIQDLVSRSSGQFVYASTVIKFVGDDYNSATSQLDIILGLAPLDGKSPYATLDALYLEILQRQPDQVFLKDFFGLFLSICNPKDYEPLLNMDRKGLLRKLRGMHSVLKVNPDIEVYHKSFTDFMQEPSRSRQYYVSQQTRTRLYLDLIIRSLERYATKMMKESSYHRNEDFSPIFRFEARKYPCWIKLPLQDCEEALDPLLRLKDPLLRPPDLGLFSVHGLRSDSSVFNIVDDLLLHLAVLRGTSYTFAVSPQQQQELGIIFPLIPSEENRDTLNGTDGSFSSLLRLLRDRDSYALESQATIDLFRVLLRVDHIKAISEVQSVSDAQNVVNFIHYAINNQELLAQCTTWKASQLALGIYTRIPVIPQLFLNSTAMEIKQLSQFVGRIYNGKYQDNAVDIWPCENPWINITLQSAFIWGTLSHPNISPLLGMYEDTTKNQPFLGLVTLHAENGTLRQWRQNMRPSVVEIRERILEVAEAIRYMHSLEIALVYPIDGHRIIMDSSFHARVPGYCLSLRYYRHAPPEHRQLCTYENNVYLFGCIFYEVYFDLYIPLNRRCGGSSETVAHRPRKPEIDECAWRLIQRCCADDPKTRPTMDQVVEGIKSWKLA